MSPSDNNYLHAYGIAPMEPPASDQTVPLWQYAKALDECNRLMYELKRERFRNYRTPYLRTCAFLGVVMFVLVASWAGPAADAFVRWWR